MSASDSTDLHKRLRSCFPGLPVLSCISEVFTILFSLPGHLVIIGHPHTALSRTYQQSIILLRQDLLKVKPNFGFYVIVPGQKMLLFFLTREHMFSTIIVVQLY